MQCRRRATSTHVIMSSLHSFATLSTAQMNHPLRRFRQGQAAGRVQPDHGKCPQFAGERTSLQAFLMRVRSGVVTPLVRFLVPYARVVRRRRRGLTARSGKTLRCPSRQCQTPFHQSPQLCSTPIERPGSLREAICGDNRESYPQIHPSQSHTSAPGSVCSSTRASKWRPPRDRVKRYA